MLMPVFPSHRTVINLVFATGLCSVTSAVHADGMVPEVPVIVLDEARGEATINIRNTETSPALLYSLIENVPEDTEPFLLLSPPVTRVEAGEVQLVRILLEEHAPFKAERLKRAVFEGIMPNDEGGGSRLRLSVKQNIPVIVRPAGLPVERQPWTKLVWRLDGGVLKVSNPSPYVVRMAATVSLLPADMPIALDRSYILPGETLSLPLSATPSGIQTGVRLFPATTYGYAVKSHDAVLQTR
jgi:P pilus assembly chaperone PapD